MFLMSPEHWLLVGSLAAIGLGILGFVWAARIWTAPATQTLIEERPAEREPVDLVAVEAALAAPVEHVTADEDPDAFIAELAEATKQMQVKDNLADPLDLEMVVTLDRLQGEEVPAFASRIDEALRRFNAPPATPHEVSDREFVHRAELSAWSKQLTGSFKTISLSSDTQEISRETVEAAMRGAR